MKDHMGEAVGADQAGPLAFSAGFYSFYAKGS